MNSDLHGLNRERLLERSCESLLGICLGLLADKKLNEDEVRFLELWLRENEAVSSVWPGSVVAGRISEILSDDKITEEELTHLKSVLTDLVGATPENSGAAGGISTSLPIDPDAAVEFSGENFLFYRKIFVRNAFKLRITS